MLTKLKKKALFKALLPLLLSAALIVEPTADILVSYAAEPENVQETTLENEGDISFSEDGIRDEETAVGTKPDAENATGDDGTNDETNISDVIDNGNEAEMTDGVEDGETADKTDGNIDNETDKPEGDVDGNETDKSEGYIDGNETDKPDDDAQDDGDIRGFEDDETDDAQYYAMPENFVLSSEQIEDKADLAASLRTFDKDSEGIKYVEREILALVDTYEEAAQIAEAYHAMLLRFDLGVATLMLKEGDSVAAALYAAADLNNNLPAVYPNYYVYMSSEPQPVNDGDDSNIEIEENMYDAESGETIASSDKTEAGLSESYEHAVSAYAEPYLQVGDSHYQWQHVNVGSVYAWNAGYTGNGIKVAILDTGGVAAAGELVYAARETAVSGSSVDDKQGHGTHVAGIIGAKLNGVGGAGIAPAAQLYSIKVLGDNGQGTDADSIRGINKALEYGADLINMSLGGVGYNPAFQIAADKAYAAGTAIFAAAGNDGGKNISYPAGYNHVICVAATDSNNQRAYFSNYGSWVDISAPGFDIYATNNKGDGGYVSKSGTSMACPVAVGEAAVILSAKLPAIEEKTGGKRVEALKSLMKSNAVSAGSGMGKGVTNLPKALSLSVEYSKPKTPAITINASEDAQRVTVSITKEAGLTVYYTTDGTALSYKNGRVSDGAKTYSEAFSISNVKSGTIQAIAVNSGGVSSSVKKVSFKLKPLVSAINISGVSKIAKGKSVALTAEVLPACAVNKKLSWSLTKSDGSALAGSEGISVSQSGKVTVSKTAASGGYIVTAAAKDKSGVSASYAITVIDSLEITSVKFEKTKLDLWSDEGTYNIAALLNAQKQGGSAISAADFKWSSSKSEVAVVSAAGVVAPKANGTVKITALANDSSGKKAVCTITVKRHAGSISITGGNKVAKGSKITLKANVAPENASNKKVKWTIENSETASGISINGSGTLSVSSKAAVGNYTVKASAEDGSGISATKTVTVVEGKITSVTLEKKSASIFRVKNQYGSPTAVSIKAELKGTGSYAQDAYTCTSSNPGIATVSASGSGNDITVTVKATGKAVGKTKVTIAATDGSNKKAVCTVSVTNPASKINILPAAGSTGYVAQGKKLKLKAGLESEFGSVANKKIKWSIAGVEASKPVKINGSGKISVDKKAVVGSKYIVLAELPDGGGSETYDITITQSGGKLRLLLYGLYTINPSTTMQVRKGSSYKFAIATDKTSVPGGLSVTSSNSKVASAMLSGGDVYIAFDKKGSATITLKANDGSGMQVKYKFSCK